MGERELACEHEQQQMLQHTPGAAALAIHLLQMVTTDTGIVLQTEKQQHEQYCNRVLVFLKVAVGLFVGCVRYGVGCYQLLGQIMLQLGQIVLQVGQRCDRHGVSAV